MLCWELEQRLSRNSPHPDVSVALENMKRSFSVPSENMKMSFSVPSVWVSVASAVPQLLLHLTLHFPGCSPVLPAKLRSFVITLIFKKTQKPFCSPRGKNLLGAPCLCAPAEISMLWRPLGCRMGSAAVTLCSAHMGTHREKPAGCLQCQPGSAWTPGEMRSSRLSVGGCTLVPQPGSAGSVLQPMSSPLPCCSCQQPRCFCNAGWSTPC